MFFMIQLNGWKVQYGYNEVGNLIQVIDDVEGLKIIMNIKYEGNNVVEDVDLNDVGIGKVMESY